MTAQINTLQLSLVNCNAICIRVPNCMAAMRDRKRRCDARKNVDNLKREGGAIFMTGTVRSL